MYSAWIADTVGASPAPTPAIGFVMSAVAALVPGTGETVIPPVVLVALLTVSTMFLRGARRFTDRERQAWTLLGVAYLLAFAGVLTGAVLFVTTEVHRAFGPPDGLILLGYSVALVAFVRFPHVEGAAPDRVRVVIDGLVGAVALGTILWVWFLGDVLDGLASAALMDRVVGMAYPIVDLSVVAVVGILILRRTALQFDIRLRCTGASTTSRRSGRCS